MALPAKVTLKTWSKHTGLKAADLKDWILDNLLPEIWVFLEWHRAMKAHNITNRSPTQGTVETALRENFTIISMNSHDFVLSGQSSDGLIWAHTVHILTQHLRTNAQFVKEYSAPETQIVAAYRFLTFLGKQMNTNRPFRSDVAIKGEGERAKNVACESEEDRW